MTARPEAGFAGLDSVYTAKLPWPIHNIQDISPEDSSQNFSWKLSLLARSRSLRESRPLPVSQPAHRDHRLRPAPPRPALARAGGGSPGIKWHRGCRTEATRKTGRHRGRWKIPLATAAVNCGGEFRKANRGPGVCRESRDTGHRDRKDHSHTANGKRYF